MTAVTLMIPAKVKGHNKLLIESIKNSNVDIFLSYYAPFFLCYATHITMSFFDIVLT